MTKLLLTNYRKIKKIPNSKLIVATTKINDDKTKKICKK